MDDDATEMPERPRVRMPYWPRLMRERDACDYLSVGVTTLREKGPKPVRIGRSIRYDIKTLDQWVDGLSSSGAPPPRHQDEAMTSEEVYRRWKAKRAGKTSAS